MGDSTAPPSTGTPPPIMRTNGEKNNATKNSAPVTMLASPVRAPASTPVALSM